MAQRTWRDKAEQMIAEQAAAAWRRANVKPDGTRYRTHRAYSLPASADVLVDCLATSDERRAKALFTRIAILGAEDN